MGMPVAAFSKILRKRSSLSRIVVADLSGGLGALSCCRAGLASPGLFVVRFFAAIAGSLCYDSWRRLGAPIAPECPNSHRDNAVEWDVGPSALPTNIGRTPDSYCGIRYRASAIVTLSLPPFF